jgi:hypothetical protein
MASSNFKTHVTKEEDETKIAVAWERMREQLGRTQTNITKQGDEKKMDVAWESMGEQLGRTPHPSQSRPMAHHSQTNIPPRTSNPQSFAQGYLQRTGEDDIQWQEESEEC